MTELTPFTLSATIKNRYIELRCSIEALTQDEAIEKLKTFLMEVQMYHDGEVIVMGQR
jgi:23S rRNA C2498 (ribose-2'-O)-methylase RlmM